MLPRARVGQGRAARRKGRGTEAECTRVLDSLTAATATPREPEQRDRRRARGGHEETAQLPAQRSATATATRARHGLAPTRPLFDSGSGWSILPRFPGQSSVRAQQCCDAASQSKHSIAQHRVSTAPNWTASSMLNPRLLCSRPRNQSNPFEKVETTLTAPLSADTTADIDRIAPDRHNHLAHLAGVNDFSTPSTGCARRYHRTVSKANQSPTCSHLPCPALALVSPHRLPSQFMERTRIASHCTAR